MKRKQPTDMREEMRGGEEEEEQAKEEGTETRRLTARGGSGQDREE